ncbi:Fic family protein [Candidatus Saccharibacteria bacterium]|nr:Fic family protein [Candidatus Saccharibacteria bacterium]
MVTSKKLQLSIKDLKLRYERLRRGKGSLLQLLDESELPELVYNSNAIENSTLTLKETERILLELQTERKVSVRELFEAKNLARVTEYLVSRTHQNLDEDIILLLHEMLLGNINDRIAGRFRRRDEYVRVGSHVAPAPEDVEALIRELLEDYAGSHERYFLDNIARFHLEFERIHPFVDGNGRIGRVLINWQLAKQGYPPVIIRNKSKHEDYYPVFPSYTNRGSVRPMSALLAAALRESLHRRIAYFEGRKIVRLVDWAKNKNLSPSSQLNAAKRQTIPAFREKNVWKIGE